MLYIAQYRLFTKMSRKNRVLFDNYWKWDTQPRQNLFSKNSIKLRFTCLSGFENRRLVKAGDADRRLTVGARARGIQEGSRCPRSSSDNDVVNPYQIVSEIPTRARSRTRGLCAGYAARARVSGAWAGYQGTSSRMRSRHETARSYLTFSSRAVPNSSTGFLYFSHSYDGDLNSRADIRWGTFVERARHPRQVSSVNDDAR